MSSIPTRQIDGDVAVGRNVSAGGDANIQGSARIGHNLRVEGWLDAPNIAGPCMGLWLTLDDLKAEWPRPRNGWYALAGMEIPASLYRAHDGIWEPVKDENGNQVKGGLPTEEYRGLAEIRGQVPEGIRSVQVDGESAGMKYLDLEVILKGGGKLVSRLPFATGSTAGILSPGLYTFLQEGAVDGKHAMAQKGQPSGFATLGSDGKLTSAQMPVITSAMLPPEMRVHVGAFDGFEELVPEQAFEQMGLSPMGAAKVHFSRSKGAFYCVKNAGSLTDRKVYCTWSGSSLMDASVAMGTEDSAKGVVPGVGKLYYCRSDQTLYLWTGSEMVVCGGGVVSGGEPEAITNEEIDALFESSPVETIEAFTNAEIDAIIDGAG